MPDGDGDKRESSTAGIPSGRELLGLGLATAAAVLVPLLLGAGLDTLLHSSPIGLLIGLVVGVTAASISVFQRFKPYL